MSLPFGAGIGRYAEDMSRWTLNLQRWMDEAKDVLIMSGLSDWYERVAKLDDAATAWLAQYADVEGELDEIDRQAAILYKAMLNGKQFACDDNPYANGWISYFVRAKMEEVGGMFEHFFLPSEIEQLQALHLL